MKKKRCKCGAAKPYRRAYSCRSCWEQTPDAVKAKLMKERTTLRLGGSVVKSKAAVSA